MSLSIHARRGASAAAVVLLAACGGGGEDPTPTPTPADKAARATATSDAHLKGRWSPVYAWPVISVHAVLMGDGRVLTYGSDTTGLQTAHANVDVWDPTQSPDAGHMTLPNGTGTDLFCSAQLVLPQSGDVFIAGGDVWNGRSTTNAPNSNSNVFDPASLSLRRGPEMKRPRWYATATTLPNGEVYVQGGSGGADRPEVRAADGSFRLLSGVDTSVYGSSYPRNFVAPDGRVFGYDAGSGRMYSVDPAANGGAGGIVRHATFDTGYSGGWYSSAAMYRPGKILQVSGNTAGAYTIDITGATPVVAKTQSLASTRAWVNATILADGQVVATSGSAVVNEPVGVSNVAEIWNPTTGQWTQGAAAQKARLYHSNALLLPDGRVLVTGGGATSPSPPTDPVKNNLSAEIYEPPYLFDASGERAVRPVITHAPAFIDIGKTFTLDVSTAVSRVTLVKTGSATHSFNMDQRFVELAFRANGGRVSVQAPTRAGEATPGSYLLFAFDAAGVPSIAKMVRVGVAANPNPQTVPVLSDPGTQTTIIGNAVNLQLAASDPNGDALTYAAAGLPPGIALDATTGRISGTATTYGSYTVVVSASDGVNSASATFTWTVQASSPLAVQAPPPPPAITTNGTATYTATATGGTNLRYRWNFGDGTPETAWSASATTTHVYTAPGTYTVTVIVTDDSGQWRSRSVTQVVSLPSTARRGVSSAPLLVADGRLWVVNPDADTVSVFNTATNAKLGEVAAGAAPRAIARAPDGRIWVVARDAATIRVFDPASRSLLRTITLPRGSQPFGLVVSPASAVAYVALEATGQVLRFDTATYAQSGSVAVGATPRHLAISGDGANLYVSRFITPPLPGEGTATVVPTAATGGEVRVVATASMSVARTIVLRHSDKPDTENAGRGIPNYLGAVAISPDGTQAYVPSKQDNVLRGALRDGTGLNFQSTVRAVSSRIDLAAGAEDLGRRVDHDNASLASAAVFDPRGVYLFVALETSREVAVVNAFNGQQLFRVDVGRAPQGLALSTDGKTLYVQDFMDRTVSVLNLVPLLERGEFDLPRLATLNTVGTEKLAPAVLIGKQLFYDARDPRLARDRYMSCASCHNDGGHDGRTWDMTSLGEGLRNTITLRGRAGMGHGFLHWSNNFDEVQDFEAQIRLLAGGTGLMNDADFNAGTRSQPLGDRKAGRSADLDALAAYVASLSSVAPAPARPAAATLSSAAAAGKAVFAAQRCAACHGGTAFTTSGENTLVDVGTLKPTSGTRNGGPLTGIDVPTLRDVWATAPYLHDGSAPTLDAAVRAHRGVSLGDTDLANLVAYLKEIGSDEPAPVMPAGNGTGFAAAYYANRTLTGTPAVTRTEVIDFDWSSNAPAAGVPADNFSVRWSGTLTVPVTGTYTFQTESDDGIRVVVGTSTVIDNWTDHGPTTDTSTAVNLVAGTPITLRVEYFDSGGGAIARLRWKPPGQSTFVTLPATAVQPVPVTPPPAATGLRGDYYANLTLAGTPVLTRTEAIDFDWGSGSPGPGVPADKFSVRWTGQLTAPATGSYRFQTVSDDGVRVTVNGIRTIDNWTDHGPTTDTGGTIPLTAGQVVPITVEYFDSGGGATIRLRWLPPGATRYDPIP